MNLYFSALLLWAKQSVLDGGWATAALEWWMLGTGLLQEKTRALVPAALTPRCSAAGVAVRARAGGSSCRFSGLQQIHSGDDIPPARLRPHLLTKGCKLWGCGSDLCWLLGWFLWGSLPKLTAIRTPFPSFLTAG